MGETRRETSEQLARALGEAVIRIWGRLPHDVQHTLFEQAATSQAEDIRAQLAICCMTSTRARPLQSKPRPCWSRTAWAVSAFDRGAATVSKQIEILVMFPYCHLAFVVGFALEARHFGVFEVGVVIDESRAERFAE